MIVQTKANRLGMYLLGQAFFSAQPAVPVRLPPIHQHGSAFVLGSSPQPHTASDGIELFHQVQPLELQMQVPVLKTSKLEVLSFPVPMPRRLYCVDERVRFALTCSGEQFFCEFPIIGIVFEVRI